MERSHSSHRRRGGRNQDPDVRLSKLLSYALRHGAVSMGLNMTSGLPYSELVAGYGHSDIYKFLTRNGFVPVSSLLSLPQFRSFSLSDIERVVSANDKQRFMIRSSEPEGKPEIRANQGHSLQVEVELSPLGTELPPQAIHGTYFRHWPSILHRGLSRMSRTHIHLSTELPDGDHVISGMRVDCEVAVFIDLPKAIADQIPFFWSANRVLLTPGNVDGVLLPKYFLKALQLRPQRKLLPLE